jgi:shikimate dehydrogenase
MQFCILNHYLLKRFGLIGYPLQHSWSLKYFQEKFAKESIKNNLYELFPIVSLSDFEHLINMKPDLVGLNVTIPYKEKIIPYLDELDEIAKEIDAVNCIKISKTKLTIPFLKGYNTDTFGFEQSILPLIKSYHKNALILGNGGSAKAVSYVLKKLNVNFLIVTRTPIKPNHISYNEITEEIIQHHLLIINTTPLGMFPNTHTFPLIPYQYLTKNHLLYDLVYNPEETIFLTKGKNFGAQIKNGLSMLFFQAEKSWKIWNNPI